MRFLWLFLAFNVGFVIGAWWASRTKATKATLLGSANTVYGIGFTNFVDSDGEPWTDEDRAS